MPRELLDGQPAPPEGMIQLFGDDARALVEWQSIAYDQELAAAAMKLLMEPARIESHGSAFKSDPASSLASEDRETILMALWSMSMVFFHRGFGTGVRQARLVAEESFAGADLALYESLKTVRDSAVAHSTSGRSKADPKDDEAGNPPGPERAASIVGLMRTARRAAEHATSAALDEVSWNIEVHGLVGSERHRDACLPLPNPATALDGAKRPPWASTRGSSAGSTSSTSSARRDAEFENQWTVLAHPGIRVRAILSGRVTRICPGDRSVMVELAGQGEVIAEANAAQIAQLQTPLADGPAAVSVAIQEQPRRRVRLERIG